jgi:hypothetical protein
LGFSRFRRILKEEKFTYIHTSTSATLDEVSRINKFVRSPYSYAIPHNVEEEYCNCRLLGGGVTGLGGLQQE